jgi:biopolymer transport protein ExbB
MFATTFFQGPQSTPAPFGPPPPPGMLHYFQCTGFVGPVLLLMGGVAAAIAVRRFLELRPAVMAPEALQRMLEGSVQQGQLDQAFAQAEASNTALGDVVAAGLLLRGQGLDEMLANTERAAIKKSLHLQARVVALSRLGTAILLMALVGTVTGLMSMMAVLATLKAVVPADLFTGIGESLAALVIGLLFAMVCWWAYGVLSARVVTRLLHVREIAEELLARAARPRA